MITRAKKILIIVLFIFTTNQRCLALKKSEQDDLFNYALKEKREIFSVINSKIKNAKVVLKILHNQASQCYDQETDLKITMFKMFKDDAKNSKNSLLEEIKILEQAKFKN